MSMRQKKIHKICVNQKGNVDNQVTSSPQGSNRYIYIYSIHSTFYIFDF